MEFEFPSDGIKFVVNHLIRIGLIFLKEGTQYFCTYTDDSANADSPGSASGRCYRIFVPHHRLVQISHF